MDIRATGRNWYRCPVELPKCRPWTVSHGDGVTTHTGQRAARSTVWMPSPGMRMVIQSAAPQISAGGELDGKRNSQSDDPGALPNAFRSASFRIWQDNVEHSANTCP